MDKGCPYAVGSDGRLYYEDLGRIYAYDFTEGEDTVILDFNREQMDGDLESWCLRGRTICVAFWGENPKEEGEYGCYYMLYDLDGNLKKEYHRAAGETWYLNEHSGYD